MPKKVMKKEGKKCQKTGCGYEGVDVIHKKIESSKNEIEMDLCPSCIQGIRKELLPESERSQGEVRKRKKISEEIIGKEEYEISQEIKIDIAEKWMEKEKLER